MSTLALAQAWKAEWDNVGTEKGNLALAQEALDTTEQNMGAHLDPGDQQEGEVISVWIQITQTEERLVLSKMMRDGTYKLQFRGRKRPI